jgi:hypothetical protein
LPNTSQSNRKPRNPIESMNLIEGYIILIFLVFLHELIFLFLAIEHGQIQTARLLIEKNIQLNEVDANGSTPLLIGS